MNRQVRWLLLAGGGVSLLAGLDASLLLLGLPAPVSIARLADVHGILMVLGFLGTVIALERAVALRQRWALLAPALLGAGGIALLTPAPTALGQILLVLGALTLVAIYAALWRRSHEVTILIQLLGGILAGCGAALWSRVELAAVLPWLVAFIVLTIAAERAELARVSMPDGAGEQLLALSGLLTAGVVTSLLWPSVGGPLFGLALVVLTLWLARHDVARRLINATGLPRFSSAALLMGYGWLALAGTLWALGAVPGAGGGPLANMPAAYDTVVHATFLGFAISMIMAHAPVILPAVLSVKLPYKPVLWAPLTVLHTGLLIRVTGNLLGGGDPLPYQAGSVLTIVAVLLLALTAVHLVATA
ncbi:hypothetical protein NF556_10635 [Ornithinimicrobium faecis]|uniref:Uncharacterized protein n=1 Tax=Ornithinimicrobium faecis TaxID=2934158 RepID=A0ABY4YZP0_9MICO|nr:hypothetical protein [Ornithinimicrobium sp. HY1793]USQ82067.1 hypothetical protein NF556_10635 [Ornithinimicrobium sp. HY1793]